MSYGSTRERGVPVEVVVPDQDRAVQLEPRVGLESGPLPRDPDMKVGQAPGAPEHRVGRQRLGQTAGAWDPPGDGFHRPGDPSRIRRAPAPRDTISHRA